MAQIGEMKIRKLDDKHTLTMHVRFMPEFHARLWLAKTLIKCAAWVLGCGIDIKHDVGRQ
jgi:hypothetical protein